MTCEQSTPSSAAAERCPACCAEHVEDVQRKFACGSRFGGLAPSFFQTTGCHIRELEQQLAAVTAERDRLRVMAELLEQADGFTSLMLPCSAELITYGDGKWVIAGRDEIYPTARAAISAAMGWQERSGT